MKFYCSLFTMNLKIRMQYKTSFVLTIIGHLITSVGSFLGIFFLFDRVQAMDVFALEEVLLSFAVISLTFSLAEFLSGGLMGMPQILGNGEFDRILVRPRNPLLQILIPHMDITRIGLITEGILILIYAASAGSITWNALKILTLVLMVFCGTLVFFALHWLQSSAAFFLLRDLKFLNIFTYGSKEFGKYPFSVYGDKILGFLTYVIPLALFQYYPLLYLTDQVNSRLYILLPVLSTLFLIPCYGLFRFGIRKFQSTGS